MAKLTDLTCFQKRRQTLWNRRIKQKSNQCAIIALFLSVRCAILKVYNSFYFLYFILFAYAWNFLFVKKN